jgi:hypothetical protein
MLKPDPTQPDRVCASHPLHLERPRSGAKRHLFFRSGIFSAACPIYFEVPAPICLQLRAPRRLAQWPILSAQSEIVLIASGKLPTWQWAWACSSAVNTRAVIERAADSERNCSHICGNGT